VCPILKANAHLNALFDACHSGSIMDLPFILDKSKWVRENDSDVKIGYVSGSAFMVSGCLDKQTSGDTIKGGIMTNAF